MFERTWGHCLKTRVVEEAVEAANCSQFTDPIPRVELALRPGGVTDRRALQTILAQDPPTASRCNVSDQGTRHPLVHHSHENGKRSKYTAMSIGSGDHEYLHRTLAMGRDGGASRQAFGSDFIDVWRRPTPDSAAFQWHPAGR